MELQYIIWAIVAIVLIISGLYTFIKDERGPGLLAWAMFTFVLVWAIEFIIDEVVPEDTAPKVTEPAEIKNPKKLILPPKKVEDTSDFNTNSF